MTTIAVGDPLPSAGTVPPQPTIWGLTPLEIHDRFWEARGVWVVRSAGSPDVAADPELFLLVGERSMAIFDPVVAADHLHWANCQLLPVRIRHPRGVALAPPGDRSGDATAPWGAGRRQEAPRVRLTTVPELAAAWASGGSTWERMRSGVPQSRRGALSLNGFYCDGQTPSECARMICRIARMWDKPDRFIERAQRVAPRVWMDVASAADKLVCRRRSVVWLGAGHCQIPDKASHDPIVMWDQPISAQAAESAAPAGHDNEFHQPPTRSC